MAKIRLGALLALIPVAGVLVAHWIAPGTTSVTISQTKIAPEVCEGDGSVLYGRREGQLTYVYCSDGLVRLLAR